MIRKVSIPLIVGMIVAAGVGPSAFLATASLLTSALLLLCVTFFKELPSPSFPLLFFFIGIFCYSSYSLPAAAAFSNPFSTLTISKALDHIPFSSEKTSELLKALLTGRKEGLDSSTVTAFRSSGASHILALSGLHLGVLYIVISKPLAILGNTVPAYRIRCCSTILISGIYVLATGAGPSIVRAFLFILLNEISKLHPERKKDGILVFWTAITVQAVLDPPVIRSVSFQLSYLAVLGILLFYPALKGFYPEGGGRWSIMRRIWNSASLSISCQILTAPLAFHYFGTFPKYFLITNLIALPLTEVLIAGGTLCAILALAGCCPAALARPVEAVASLLVNSLETISGM